MKTSVKRKSVLLVGDSFFIPLRLAASLQKHGYNLVSTGSEPSEIISGIRMKPDIILVDYDLHHNDPYRTIALLHSALPRKLHRIDEWECTAL